MSNAFTLIELLVVVLIIGILAAVAVPQYQKAVEKSRIATALTVMDGVKKSMDIWLLENEYPSGNKSVRFLWLDSFVETTNVSKAESAIDTRQGLDCSGDYECTDGVFLYNATCNNSNCMVNAFRSMAAWDGEGDYTLGIRRSFGTNQWEYECTFFDSFGERICSMFQGQDNWNIEDAR